MSDRPIYYTRDGQPLGRVQDVDWSDEGGLVAWTGISPDVTVSTVFLGNYHNFGDGPPLIFETMVFGGSLDEACERYSTEEQARAGHDEMVRAVEAALAGDLR